ncbi:MAG: holo-[acyl-carrier-protein] synthase [Gammaproteobacteria bacterium]|nr:MAG: holo-[acyl-carrier-protein] synthase [Gammaproteobacteria bacterium]
MLGIDIVSNERIRKSLETFGERFLERIYTEREIEYCQTFRDPVPCLAARWAAKEAVIKAYFQIFGKVLKFKQIEVLGKKGYPATAVILGKEGEQLKKHNLKVIISLAHERDYSVAVAQIVRKEIPSNGVS